MLAVIPFFRASVRIGPEERRLFNRNCGGAEFAACLRRSPATLRSNTERILLGAIAARQEGGALVLVEGWRSNEIALRSGRSRLVTGSRVSSLLLRMLQRRGAAPAGFPVVRLDRSRCTWEEAAAAAAARVNGRPPDRLLAVTSGACPSAPRLRRYLRLATALPFTVLTPSCAKAGRGPALSPEQAAVLAAACARPLDRIAAPFVEAPNWIVHGASRLAQRIGGPGPSLEVWLARRLRQDPPPRRAP